MVEVKTSELKGKALDWAVAVAARHVVLLDSGDLLDMLGGWDENGERHCFSPKDNWGQLGALVERIGKKIGLELRFAENSASFQQSGVRIGYTASDVMIAACRAIVAAELGEAVQVPDELA